MAFRPVLEIAVTHPYLAAGPLPGALPGAMIVPDDATAALLRGLRLLARPTGERFTVFGTFGSDGKPAIVAGAPLALRFGLARPGSDLLAATDTAALGDAPLFTDEGAAAADPQPLKLARGKGAAGSAMLAEVAIRLAPAEIAAAGSKPPRHCTVALPASAANWCYHVVTDIAAPLADWRIARGAGAGGPAPVFADAGRTELAKDDPADPIGTALRRRNPGARVLRFVSKAPFAASAAAVRGLELHAGTTRLFGSLPNPSPADPGRIGDAPVFGRTLHVVTT